MCGRKLESDHLISLRRHWECEPQKEKHNHHSNLAWHGSKAENLTACDTGTGLVKATHCFASQDRNSWFDRGTQSSTRQMYQIVLSDRRVSVLKTEDKHKIAAGVNDQLLLRLLQLLHGYALF